MIWVKPAKSFGLFDTSPQSHETQEAEGDPVVLNLLVKLT